MSESTKNRINFNQDVLQKLNERYDYSLDYIRKCVRGDRVGIMPDIIKKEYFKLEAAAIEGIETKAKQLK